MKTPLLLENQIQDYAWGSKTAIQELLGAEENNIPWAELWMGAHPKAPSSVVVNNEKMPLDDLVRRYPDTILGAEAAAKFNNTLPFLFKVLAAAHPLSIQAHP
ncbi:MAG: type I phosphomannose isomerase catalytic subunit, partial [Thermodesulfobacteriota bacterium]